ncbi:thiazolylpeptide-type bacteriocin [Kitasatospora purpeofusca]|uniref:thiazolylpeptide-type bacteriocin n=1 Tax=Kitasatospora purpeofusca TaxID=67352 RepID=UPI0033E4AFED|nr:thiazolylpeptide-type bacteriocin [Kitasatospora purpeofusca]
MSDQLQDALALDGLDLDLGELTVTALRDSIALPEGGASSNPASSSCQSSSNSSIIHPPTTRW